MGLLNMSSAEYNYYVDQIRQGMSLIGQEAWLYQVDTEVKDLYRDPEVTYKKAERINLIFEDNPKPILKKMNWFSEDEELPYVAHIVALNANGEAVEVRENMKIKIMSELGLKTERIFNVEKVTGNHINPVTWICKLTPFREKVDMEQGTEEFDERRGEKTDTGYGYLNI